MTMTELPFYTAAESAAFVAARRAAAGPDAEPEPGTRQWQIETGSYTDPEPDWDRGEPYADPARGVMYYDTRAGYEAGRQRYPSHRHVAPDAEPDQAAREYVTDLDPALDHPAAADLLDRQHVTGPEPEPEAG